MPRTFLSLALLACASASLAEPAKPQAAKSPYVGGNRLAYLDQIDPYYPHRDFAKLITPQWVGEEGVEAVVILSIDDMRDPVRYEAFLRPILDRLKKVGNSDGLSRLSIFTNSVDPKHEQLQKWLKEGLSFEVHTITHPCPCLGQGAAIVGAKPGTIDAAKQTYDGCVDLLHQIPNYKGPVAFRMPCCDSMNSVSPRFFAEVMNKTTKEGHFLSIDSSVFNVFTSDDPALPRELVQENDGSERFAKYAKFPGFVNTIENYPYPYVIGNMIWQFPCVVPSDWEAQHLHKPNNPKTVEDLKANLDCTVIKQGVFTLVFHPHGWIKAEQVVELIDHAEKKHGKKVKFLNFQDALERINRHALEGKPLRQEDGSARITAEKPTLKPAERLIDLNGDGKLDRIFSDGDQYSVALFDTKAEKEVLLFNRKRSDTAAEKQILPIIRADGTNNGFFVKGDALYWQNEDTGGKEPHHVKKITFAEVLALADAKPGAAAPAEGSYTGKSFTTAHTAPPPPRSPEASRDAIKVREGFRVELVAAEPLVIDPIAFDWGPDGKLWVVEMGDYPAGADGKGKAGGRVIYLEDTDSDGKYDKRTVFLDSANMPTGVMVWKKGVLVTAAPDIFYAEDTDNDGKADKREVLFTGFAEGNPQHRVNGLRWGLDGWIYIANGDSGGTVIGLQANEDPLIARRDHAQTRGVNINGRDLRITPWELMPASQKLNIALGSGTPPRWDIEPQSGQSQFGRDRDDFGNWFGNNNPNPGWHYALEDHYLRRNPHVAAPSPRVDLTSDRTVYPISIVHSPSIENHRITPGQPAQHSSANSLTIYRDELFGEHFRGNAFISEPVHNLVRRLVLKPQGVTFTASRAPGEERSEFLASSDPWFRPTMLRTGPDGCLWIADMYRQTIEHPQWIPPAWQKAVNLREGDDKGRIYRVVPVHAKPRAALRLDKLDAKGLAQVMDSPNGWQRDMVQMMLLWLEEPAIPEKERMKLKELREDLMILQPGHPAWEKKVAEYEALANRSGTVGALRSLASEATRPMVRAQALWTLHQLDFMDAKVLARAAGDGDPGVRREAAKIGWDSNPGGLLLNDATRTAELTAALLRLAEDADAKVRQQLAYSLHDLTGAAAGKALAAVLLKDGGDPYIVAACMSSVLPHLGTVLAEVVAAPGDISQRVAIIQQLISIAVAADKLGALGAMLDVITLPHGDQYQPWQFMTLSRLLDALAKKNITLAQLREKAEKSEPRDRKLIMTLDRVPNIATVARAIIVDPAKAEALRVAAIELYGRSAFAPRGQDDRLATFSAALADVRNSPAVQQAAAQAIARTGGEKSFAALLAGWKAHAPSLRAAILDALLRQDEGITALLDALEKNLVSRHDIDVPRRQPLLMHKDKAVRERATKVLGGPVNADRQAVIDRYFAAMQKAPILPDAQAIAAGRAVFEKNCAVCHKLTTAAGEIGKGIGPDLQKIVDGSPQALLAAILDPNRAVEAKYINYLAEKKDGERVTGIITTETGTSITIVGVDGREQVILRSDIESLHSTNLSLMPEGLEQAISTLDMAHLLAFIGRSGPPAKTFENNRPVKIEADAKGVLTLPASAAEVYGPSLIFEQQYRNLGYWSSDRDYAAWTLVVPKDGKYEVTIDYALNATVKNNAYLLAVGAAQLTGPVPGTGSWDTYKKMTLGTLELKAGAHRLTFRSNGPVSGALIDLRTIVLTPK